MPSAYYSEPLQRFGGQDEKRVMAIGREYRNVRMLSKNAF